MITRIVIDNYMSHAHTVIEPAAGLTVVVGPNNCGKSAVVSALQTLCGDHDGDFMVRHGEKSCSVTVETDDGHTITWRRIKGKVSYVLDGEEVHRASRANLPDELHDLLRLPKVPHPSGDKEFDVHFGGQKSPIFLIDKESDTAAFFSTASDAEKLLEIQKLHKQKAQESRRRLNETNKELADIQAQLNSLAPLDPIAQQLNQVDHEQQELHDADQRLESLRLHLQQAENRAKVVTYHRHQTAALAPLQSPPALADTDTLESCIRTLAQTAGKTALYHRRAAALSSLAPPPALVDIAPLERLIADSQRLRQRIAATAAQQTCLADLTEPPTFDDTQSLIDFLTRFVQARRQARVIQRREAALATLTEPPALADPAPLHDLVARLTAATATVVKHRQTIADVDQKLAAFDADFTQWLWANPNCPTCGAPTTREHLLHGGPSHA